MDSDSFSKLESDLEYDSEENTEDDYHKDIPILSLPLSNTSIPCPKHSIGAQI
jgi:hypothetical protein